MRTAHQLLTVFSLFCQKIKVMGECACVRVRACVRACVFVFSISFSPSLSLCFSCNKSLNIVIFKAGCVCGFGGGGGGEEENKRGVGRVGRR